MLVVKRLLNQIKRSDMLSMIEKDMGELNIYEVAKTENPQI